MRSHGGEHDDFHVRLPHRMVEGAIEVVGHLHVLRVALLGAVQCDPSHPWTGLIVEDGLKGRKFGLGHRLLLCGYEEWGPRIDAIRSRRGATVGTDAGPNKASVHGPGSRWTMAPVLRICQRAATSGDRVEGLLHRDRSDLVTGSRWPRRVSGTFPEGVR